MSEQNERWVPPERRDAPAVRVPFYVRFHRGLIFSAVVVVASAVTGYVAMSEPEEAHMERVQADDRRRFLLMLESMYGDILTAKDLPEDIQEAEVDADVKAFAIAYAYAELADWMHDIRALPILPLADIPQNLRTRQKEREGLVVSSHDKLKEGILTAVQIRRQGDPVPQVITNKAGVPEFEWRRWFEKREP